MREGSSMDVQEKDRAEALKKYRRIKLALKIVGVVVAAAGLGLAVMGFADMFLSTADGGSPSLFWGLIAGLPLLGVGGMLCLAGFRREIVRYTKDETVPVLNEAGQELTPAVSAIAETVKSAGEDLCPHCGEPNEKDAKFCRHCGNAFFVTCPHCSETVKEGKFCDKCGEPLH